MIPVFIDYYRISTVGTNFIPSPRGYPRSSNRYYMNRHHTMHSYACKKFDPVGVIRILVCELPYWVIWVEYLCLGFPMYSILWGQIIYIRLGYTFTCRKAIRQSRSIFLFLSEAL